MGPKRRKVVFQLRDLHGGSATDSYAHHIATKLRTCAARIDSYSRQGYRMEYVGTRDGHPEFIMARPLPKKVREQLEWQLDREIVSGPHGFYLPEKIAKRLIAAGIVKLRDLVTRTEDDLLFGERKVRGLGFVGVSHIRSRLDHENLKLGMNTDELLGKKPITQAY